MENASVALISKNWFPARPRSFKISSQAKPHVKGRNFKMANFKKAGLSLSLSAWAAGLRDWARGLRSCNQQLGGEGGTILATAQGAFLQGFFQISPIIMENVWFCIFRENCEITILVYPYL